MKKSNLEKFIQEIESTPEGQAQLEEGRKWVMDELYDLMSQEPIYHLRQYGDVTQEQLDEYLSTGKITK